GSCRGAHGEHGRCRGSRERGGGPKGGRRPQARRTRANRGSAQNELVPANAGASSFYVGNRAPRPPAGPARKCGAPEKRRRKRSAPAGRVLLGSADKSAEN